MAHFDTTITQSDSTITFYAPVGPYTRTITVRVRLHQPAVAQNSKKNAVLNAIRIAPIMLNETI